MASSVSAFRLGIPELVRRARVIVWRLDNGRATRTAVTGDLKNHLRMLVQNIDDKAGEVVFRHPEHRVITAAVRHYGVRSRRCAPSSDAKALPVVVDELRVGPMDSAVVPHHVRPGAGDRLHSAVMHSARAKAS